MGRPVVVREGAIDQLFDPYVVSSGPSRRSAWGALVPVTRPARESWRLRGQRVGALQLGDGQRAGIEAVGEHRRRRRIELAAEPVGAATDARLPVAAEPAVEARPLQLRREVQRQAVVADAHHVLRLPPRGLVAQEPELEREEGGRALRLRDEGVHPRHEALRHALRVGAVGQPLPVHVVAIEDGPRHGVALGKRRARGPWPSPPSRASSRGPSARGDRARPRSPGPRRRRRASGPRCAARPTGRS